MTKHTQTEYTKTLVSIVIPTYNQSEYIEQSIGSVMEQSYKNLEIIVADDCSTDGTVDIIKKLAKKDPRIKLLLSSKNQGIPANFNKAFDAVTGEFVAFLGGDDLMFPNKIEKMVKLLQADTMVGLVYSDMEVFESDTNKTLFKKSEKGVHPQPLNWTMKIDWYLQKRDTGILPSACLAKTDYYLQASYDNRFYLKHELYFTIEDYYKNPHMKWVYLDEVLGRYRFHSNNFSKTSQANKSIVRETFLLAELTKVNYPQSRVRVNEHLKYYTYFNLLFESNNAIEFKQFNEIYKTFNFSEKLHLGLSRFFYRYNLLTFYLKLAKIFGLVGDRKA